MAIANKANLINKKQSFKIKNMNKMLSGNQVAEMFNVSKATIYRLVETRKIPFYKIGGVLRFGEDDITKYLEQSRINTIK